MQKSMPVDRGGMMILQPNRPLYAWTQEETVVQLHGTVPWGVTFVNPADEQRST